MKALFILALILAATGAADGQSDKSARYGPLDSQSGSMVDATPGTTRADQRSVCERLKGKDKVSCLKKKPKQLDSHASQR